jgi:hypothetical protein
LSEPENVRLISTRLVPVALNLYTIREAKDAAGDFFRAVHKQRPNYQGLWMVSPEGKVLAAHHDHKDEETWPQEVRAFLRGGLRGFGDKPPRKVVWRDPLPLRGRGVRPDGSITLAVSIRITAGGQPSGPGAIDSINLSARELAELAPPKPAAGRGWSIPDEVTRKLAKCLSPSSDQSVMPRPEEVKECELIGNVRRVEDGVASLTFSGDIRAVHKNPFLKGKINRASARIHGAGLYDVGKKRMLALVLVLEGEFYSHAPYDREPIPIAAGVEWRLRPPAARTSDDR